MAVGPKEKSQIVPLLRGSVMQGEQRAQSLRRQGRYWLMVIGQAKIPEDAKLHCWHRPIPFSVVRLQRSIPCVNDAVLFTWEHTPCGNPLTALSPDFYAVE